MSKARWVVRPPAKHLEALGIDTGRVVFGEAEDGDYVEEWIYTRMRLYAPRLIFTEGKLTGIISGPTRTKPLMNLQKKQKDDVKQESETIQEQ